MSLVRFRKRVVCGRPQNCSPGSSRFYRLGVSQARKSQGVGRWAPATTRFICLQLSFFSYVRGAVAFRDSVVDITTASMVWIPLRTAVAVPPLSSCYHCIFIGLQKWSKVAQCVFPFFPIDWNPPRRGTKEGILDITHPCDYESWRLEVNLWSVGIQAFPPGHRDGLK